VRLRDVTFDTWLRSHGKKDPKERWLRELYPWPVLAQVDCDERNVGQLQRISYDGADYDVTLKSVQWQERGTYRYRLRIESDGLGWHSRSFSDDFDLCGTADGAFVTLFHARDEEPLEKIARAFFSRRWKNLSSSLFKSLAVSRFLAASIVAQVVEQAFRDLALTHYPGARLVGGVSPMFASGSELWVGYRFFSEDAYAWARRSAGSASRVIALYFADTKYQFLTDLPPGVEVQSISQLDAIELGSRYEELIRVLLRGLELPEILPTAEQLESIVTGQTKAPPSPVLEADVHEALAALKRPCSSKSELRYQLAAAIVLNIWIEDERRLGFVGRKKFYAFKQKVGALVQWAANARLDGVTIWAEDSVTRWAKAGSKEPILYIRIDDVDFSFHAIPGTNAFLKAGNNVLTFSGVRLKPIAPIVFAWARALRSADPR
jgi:hypothetical protein